MQHNSGLALVSEDLGAKADFILTLWKRISKMKIINLIILIFLLQSCGWFKHENKKREVTTSEKVQAVEAGLKEYCERAVENYKSKNGRIHGCDSALFAGLLGVACDGVDVQPFEDESAPGKMCRTWECNCFIPPQGDQPAKDNGAKAGYSKDMNAGIMMNQIVKPVPALIDRIISYLKDNNLVMCQAIDSVTFASRCVMPPTTYNKWIDLQTKIEGKQLHLYEPEKEQNSDDAVPKKDFENHLEVVGILTEEKIYGGISDSSLKKLEAQAARQPNNALFVGAYSRFSKDNLDHAADLWLAQCPLGRFPNNRDDQCTSYRYQRDEESTDSSGQPNWKPCPQEPFEEYPGVDCAFAAWVISKG